jgi:hypothetical protein
MKHPRQLLALFLSLIMTCVLSCSRCRAQSKVEVTSVERMLPKGAVAVVVAPSVEMLGQKLLQLQQLKTLDFAAALQGLRDAPTYADALMRQIGFDLRVPAALAAAGIDGKRAMAVFITANARAYVVLPIADEKMFRSALHNVASKRFGAPLQQNVNAGAVTVEKWTADTNSAARIACVLKGGYALVATDEGIGALATLGATPAEQTLEFDSNLKARQTSDTSPKQLWFYFPPGSPALTKLHTSDAFGSLTLSDVAFTVRLAGQWQGDPRMLEALSRVGPPAKATLPSNTFASAQSLSSPASLVPLAITVLGERSFAILKEANIDLQGAVLKQVLPGTVAGLSLAERPPIGQGVPQLDIRQTNPFRYVNLSGIAPLTPDNDLDQTLKALAVAGPRFGANINPALRGTQQTYLTTYAQGEGVHFARLSNTFVFGSPQTKFAALLDRLDLQPVSLPASAFSAKVDVDKLAQGVRALPGDAWGVGGFAMKATTERWLSALDDFKDLVLTVDSQQSDIVGTLTVNLNTSKTVSPKP